MQPHSASHKQVHSMQRVLQRLTESLLPVMVAVLMHLHTSYVPLSPFRTAADSFSSELLGQSPHCTHCLRCCQAANCYLLLVNFGTGCVYYCKYVHKWACALFNLCFLTYLNLLPAPDIPQPFACPDASKYLALVCC